MCTCNCNCKKNKKRIIRKYSIAWFAKKFWDSKLDNMMFLTIILAMACLIKILIAF